MKLESQFVARVELQKQIDILITQVQEGGSQAILVYGDGGVGKTSFLRNMVQQKRERVVWLGPFDVDDAQFWLLPQVAQEIIQTLDQDHQSYFEKYLKFLADVPDFEREKIGHETALTKLQEGDNIFFACYELFVNETKQTAVLILDTVEAIRGLDVLTKLISWIKQLPKTLVLLAARPPVDANDAILDNLSMEPKIAITAISLPKFTEDESRSYLKMSIDDELDDDSINKLIFLCDGYPLILTLMVDHLSKENLPKWFISKKGLSKEDWFVNSLPHMRKNENAERNEFQRLLMSQFRSSEFWPEAIKRLGVVRHRLDKDTWIKLMSDRDLPSDVKDWDEAWKKLYDFQWIRKRSNGKEVTLHDALAEQLAKWVIPLDDKDGAWRLHLWQKASSIYDAPINELFEIIEREIKEFEQITHSARMEKSASVLQKAINLDIQVVKYYLLNIARLYYVLLNDFDAGIHQFNVAFDQAYRKHEYRYIELLWAELQRFLPGSQTFDPLQDVIKGRTETFRNVFRKSKDYRYNVGSRIAKYLIDFEETYPAINWLTELLVACKTDLEKAYELYRLRGNAYLRTPSKAKEAGEDFQRAYKITQNKKATPWLKALEGEALMELGYYYRNTGDWRKAGESYSKAIDAIPYNKPLDLARVQSQYAYVQALLGDYDRASKQIEASLRIRRKAKDQRAIGMSLSVQGEVYRYMQRFVKAWNSYTEAEQIFEELDISGWLGLVRQEMAICLVRARDANVRVGRWQAKDKLTDGVKREMLEEARRLSLDAVELCRIHSSRSLPSALNRAGRILAMSGEVDKGLEMLLEGELAAEKVTDLWFRFSNLVEYVELCYQTWQVGDRKHIKYLKLLEEQRENLEKARRELTFPNLQGRWEVMKGHLLAEEGLALGDSQKANLKYDEALDQYKNGYVLIVTGYAASQGIAGLSRQMVHLRRLLNRLSEQERERWFKELIEVWRAWPVAKEREQLDPLFAEISELYTDFVKLN